MSIANKISVVFSHGLSQPCHMLLTSSPGAPTGLACGSSRFLTMEVGVTWGQQFSIGWLADRCLKDSHGV